MNHHVLFVVGQAVVVLLDDCTLLVEVVAPDVLYKVVEDGRTDAWDVYEMVDGTHYLRHRRIHWSHWMVANVVAVVEADMMKGTHC